jgi:hypothetical protein
MNRFLSRFDLLIIHAELLRIKRPVISGGPLYLFSNYFFLLLPMGFAFTTGFPTASTDIEGAGALERMTAQASNPSKARPTAYTAT